ncbi:DUF2059 domain-containing protein [Flavobacterium sp.]|uniref:DUF2059 domain-containing protein n=1 Tax=Flavobacterium sp. TaxID=239 RepID=UPI003751C7C5
MKKVILTLALVVATQFGFAQAKKDVSKKATTTVSTSVISEEDYKKEVLKVVDKSAIGSQLSMIKDQVIGQIPADKQAAFLVDFDASLTDLKEKLVPVYMEAFTKEEIKAMNVFYSSPVGKKMDEKAAELNTKSQEIAKTWGEGFQATMMKYMQ